MKEDERTSNKVWTKRSTNSTSRLTIEKIKEKITFGYTCKKQIFHNEIDVPCLNPYRTKVKVSQFK